MKIFLETERMLLRGFTTGDADLLVELDSDPEVMRYLTGGRPTPRETIVADVLPRIFRRYEQRDGCGTWAAEARATGGFLGWFELEPKPGDPPASMQLGYRLRRSAWGNGYATEGARALVHYGFADLGAERVWAETMSVNNKSRRVMEKAGLRYFRTSERHVDDPIPGTEHGEVEYELLRSDWRTWGGPAVAGR